MTAKIAATTIVAWIEIFRCASACCREDAQRTVERESRSQVSNPEPGAVKPRHECAGQREACGILIATEQGYKMLEGDLEQGEKGNHEESGPGKLVAWQLRRSDCTRNGTQRRCNDSRSATTPIDGGVGGWLARVWRLIVHPVRRPEPWRD